MPAVVAQRRPAIRALAGRHGVAAMRWWPAVADLDRMDFLVEGGQTSLGRFRADLERLLGCPVAVYPAELLPAEARTRIWAETVGI
ncbi:MAG TPA: nucleotidyltransferase [Candidatus Dormibacteraeota bacterium]|nr:nucleotidyltransferase [Candidatus Dormibacteraeota bacterium]